MSDFDKLLDELNAAGEETQELRKAMDNDEGADENDERIQAAADAGDGEGDDEGGGAGDAGADAGAEGDGEGGEGGDDQGEEEPMGKSFMIQLENGDEVEAFDGTEMLKSLRSELDKSNQRLEQTEQRSAEALEKAIGMVKEQNTIIKSLQEDLKAVRSAGRGRKAVVAVSEGGKEQLQKSQEMTGQEFMTKAMSAMEAGRLTGMEVSRAESYLNKGLSIPQDLVDKVLQ